MTPFSRRTLLRLAALSPALPLAGCADAPVRPPPADASPFQHGVASGDPLADAVILWTRVTPPGPQDPVELAWEVADDAAFDRVVAVGSARVLVDTDHTVHVDAGGLAAGRTYYYRFHALGFTSPTGRTRTAPSGDVARARFAAVSCASLAHGWQHVYRRVAARADLDAVVHLGDAIYEYPSGAFGDVRPYEPPHACVSLADYRARYAQYRRDADVREVHRQHPMLAVWDDHEFANNAWHGGADIHDPAAEGPWPARAVAAARAWREWMPARAARQEMPGRHDGERRIWRGFAYGDLVDVVMLDTRLWGRDAQVAPGSPELMDARRQLLGADQERWFFERLSRSTARWKLVAQQVQLGHQRDGDNTDQWDGYPSARQRLLDLLRAMAVRDVAVLTGDRHTSWAMDVAADPFDAAAYDPATGRGALAVEFITPGVSAPALFGDPAKAEARLRAENPHLKYLDLANRGYVVVDVTRERLQGAFFHVDGVERPTGDREWFAAALSTASGDTRLVRDDAPATPPDDAPPLAPA